MHWVDIFIQLLTTTPRPLFFSVSATADPHSRSLKLGGFVPKGEDLTYNELQTGSYQARSRKLEMATTWANAWTMWFWLWVLKGFKVIENHWLRGPSNIATGPPVLLAWPCVSHLGKTRILFGIAGGTLQQSGWICRDHEWSQLCLVSWIPSGGSYNQTREGILTG